MVNQISLDKGARERFANDLRTRVSQVLKPNHPRCTVKPSESASVHKSANSESCSKAILAKRKTMQNPNALNRHPLIQDKSIINDQQVPECGTLLDAIFLADVSATEFISDTGATRGVAGEQPMTALINSLPTAIRS